MCYKIQVGKPLWMWPYGRPWRWLDITRMLLAVRLELAWLSMAGSGIGNMEALDSTLRQSIITWDVAVNQNTCLHLPQFPPLPFPPLKWSVHLGLSRPSEPVHRHMHMTHSLSFVIRKVLLPMWTKNDAESGLILSNWNLFCWSDSKQITQCSLNYSLLSHTRETHN